jgi:hypothetical protein
MSWGDGGMSENGKRWESGPMDLFHVEKGARQRKHYILDPTPPSLKADRSGGSEKDHQLSIGAPVVGS